MKLTRRELLSSVAVGAVALALPTTAFATTVPYSSDTFASYLESGETFLLGVHAKWCSTCARQTRVINALREQGDFYNNLVVMEVDWDEERNGSLVSDLNIPRRSTLIMFKGGEEVGRVVAGTGEQQIKDLIDSAL
ncbi:MAG: thioredoxin family protein [Pseudomonadota bacterium]